MNTDFIFHRERQTSCQPQISRVASALRLARNYVIPIDYFTRYLGDFWLDPHAVKNTISAVRHFSNANHVRAKVYDTNVLEVSRPDCVEGILRSLEERLECEPFNLQKERSEHARTSVRTRLTAR